MVLDREYRYANRVKQKMSNKIYGYVRASKPQQSAKRREIRKAYPDADIRYEEKEAEERPEWNKLMQEVNPGDTIVFDSISVMSRSADEGVETYFSLYDRGINLIFLKEEYINSSTYAGVLRDEIDLTETVGEVAKELRDSFRKFAEKQIRIVFEQSQKAQEKADERSQNIGDGIKKAVNKGKSVGRKKGKPIKTKKEEAAEQIIRDNSKSFGGNLSDVECMKLAGVSRNSYYKYKNLIIGQIAYEEMRNGVPIEETLRKYRRGVSRNKECQDSTQAIEQALETLGLKPGSLKGDEVKKKRKKQEERKAVIIQWPGVRRK